ncbi:uncharacterized protein BCR38DRAFT_467728 [Pseudomassariella vexata]|uniref:Rhodopsin domain-containing protein n=1 Tax=Pseudomassariella vexata TaxID=1141098 RepID=A0A1Y2DPT5_9PEZI|nr:uncharacterized protein BCR38DRAFT_467728 [Pseudomassariella vexata]ORY60675.1 hypothetical protein BCR38DRAFT_467728 [Pseudomassariella vexata]
MSDKSNLLALLGSYDNLNETEPPWNRGSTVVPVSIIFLVILWICVIFRIYTRLIIVRSPGWDDVFVVLVTLSSTCGSICICLAVTHGLGKHFILLPYSETMAYLELFYIANGTYSMSTAFVKLSLLLQYMRIFQEERSMRLICIIVLVFTGLWGCAYSIMAWFPCFPVHGYWTWTVPSTCYGFGSLDSATFFGTYASSSGINMVLDIIVLIIPFPLYFRKNTPNRTKMGLLALLFLGGCINFLSIWRLATIVEHKAGTKPTFDPTFYGPISILLAVLETDVAGICASIPVFWPVLTAELDRIFVTQEIKIERAHRFSNMGDAEEYELQRGTTAELQHTERSLHSRTTSEESLNQNPDSKQARVKESHYMDEYVAAQVDPLNVTHGVESHITSQGMVKKKWKVAF